MSKVISVDAAQHVFARAAAGEDKVNAFVELVKSFEHDHTISARGVAAATSNAFRQYDAFAGLCITHESAISAGVVSPETAKGIVQNAVRILRADADQMEKPPYNYQTLSDAMRAEAEAVETAWTKIAPALNLPG